MIVLNNSIHLYKRNFVEEQTCSLGAIFPCRHISKESPATGHKTPSAGTYELKVAI